MTLSLSATHCVAVVFTFYLSCTIFSAILEPMSKTHTTTQILTASKFNSHDSTGDCVLEIGPVLFNGTIVTIGGYKIRYNGIIAETTDIVTHDTAGYNYLCVTGIDASPTSTPYTLVTNVRQGVCLIEKYHDGWITKDNKFKGDFRGLPFTRTYDSVLGEFHACYGPGVCNDGTLVHTPIKLTWILDHVSGSQAYPGISDGFGVKNTVALGTIVGYGCNGHLVIYSDVVATSVTIKNNKSSFMTSDTILGVLGTCHAIIETSPTHCNYAYSNGADLYIGECEYGVAAGAATTYTFTSNVTKVDFVTPTTIIVQLADNTFIYGMIMPTTIDTIFSGSSRWFHVDHKNGDFVHIGTDDKLYLNVVEIGSTTHFAFVFDKQIIQVTAAGDIINGGKTTETGFLVTNVVTNRTTTNELFFLFINGGGVDAVSYNVYRGETTWSDDSLGTTLCAATFAESTILYMDDDEKTYEQPIAPGSLLEPDTLEIMPSEHGQWRFNKKQFTISGDYLGENVFVDSNTIGRISGTVGTVNIGTYNNHAITSMPVPSIYVGPKVCDGDYVESLHAISLKHYYTKILAIDYDGTDKGFFVPTTPTGAIPGGACNVISGNIVVSGGTILQMVVNAADSVVYNANIQVLDIYVAKNVMFVGCTIGAYTDWAVAPDTNEYQFIGCTIGGVPAGTFQALTDTPMAYGTAGDMLVTNGTATGLEFSTVAKQASATEFNYLRQDMVNNVATGTWAEPASLAIHQSVKDPTGFEDISNCTISYDPAVRVVTLTFTGDTYIWHHGKRNKFENGQSFTWPDHTDNSGIYFMYLEDDGVGGLQVHPAPDTAFWDLSEVIPVSYVIYKDTADGGPDGFASEERHGHTWPWSIHRDVHLDRGAWTPSGFAASGYTVGGTAIADKKITIATGVVVDEDIWNTVPDLIPGTYVHFWLNAANEWTWASGETFPVPYAASAVPATQNPKYNELTVGLTEIAANNTWFNTYVFATNSLSATFQYVVIVGQQIYTSLAAAQGESISSLSLGTGGAFPFQECVALYQITWRRGPYDAGLALNPYARIDAVTRIIGERITVAGLSSSSHAALSDRDLANSHPASAIGSDNTTSELVDVDVQSNIDELSSGFAKIIRDATFTDPATFDTIEIMPKFLPVDDCVFSCEIDVLVTVISDTVAVGPTTPGTMAHRKIMATVHVASGAIDTYTIRAQDTDIYYEDTEFTAIRTNPVPYLGAGTTDCIELYTDADEFGVIVRGIKYVFAGPGEDTTASVTRYSVTFNINSVDYV